MSGLILGMLAETFVHPGSGQSEGGAIDLPVARERTTGYPFVPGSGVKGAMKDKAQHGGFAGLDAAFGRQEEAGQLRFSDARLLLLPVRCLTAAYRWLTCPHLIERYVRDHERVCGNKPSVSKQGSTHSVEDLAQLYEKLAQVNETKNGSPAVIVRDAEPDHLFLEERCFAASSDGDTIDRLVALISPLISHESAKNRLPSQLAVVCDEDFAWFATSALPIHAHNFLDDETKASRSLWYEETLAPDTLLYTLVTERGSGTLTKLANLLKDNYLQLGGNETVGQGWFKVAIVEGGEGAS